MALIAITSLVCLTALILLSILPWILVPGGLPRFPSGQAAFVLDGDQRALERPVRAVDLLHSGHVRRVFVSGVPLVPGLHQSTIVVNSLRLDSMTAAGVWELRQSARSTVEEVRQVLPVLRAQGIDTVVLVTSEFHLRRAMSVFTHLAGGDPVAVPAASMTPGFDQGWTSREGAKILLLEATKTLWWHLVERWTVATMPPGAHWPDTAVIVAPPMAGRLDGFCPDPVPCPVVVPVADTCITPSDTIHEDRVTR